MQSTRDLIAIVSETSLLVVTVEVGVTTGTTALAAVAPV